MNPFDRFSFLEIVRSTKLFLSSRDKWFLGVGPSFNWITFHLHIFKTVTKDICSVSRFSSDFYRLHYLFRLSPPIKHAVFKIYTPQIQFFDISERFDRNPRHKCTFNFLLVKQYFKKLFAIQARIKTPKSPSFHSIREGVEGRKTSTKSHIVSYLYYKLSKTGKESLSFSRSRGKIIYPGIMSLSPHTQFLRQNLFITINT